MGRFDGWIEDRIVGYIRGFGHGYDIEFTDDDGGKHAGRVHFDDMACHDPGLSGGEFVWWVFEDAGPEENGPVVGNMPLIAGDALEVVRREDYGRSQHAGSMGWLTGPWYALAAENAIRRAADGAGILVREPRTTGDEGLRPLSFDG